MTLFSLALRHSRRLSTAVSAKPLTLSQLKLRLRDIHDPDEALKLYTSFISGNHPSTSSSSARHPQEYVIRLLAKSDRFSDIESLLESHKSSSHISQEHFVTSLIRSYGVAGMFQNALKTYEQMSELGTPRSALSFNGLLFACVHCKMFDRVISYFDEFPAKFGFSPNMVSYSMLIKSYCGMGSLDTAIEKLNEMQDKGFEVDAIVFTTIYHSLYANGRTKEAESFWDEMVNQKGVKPDSVCYSNKLHHIQHGDIDGFKKIIEEMNHAGVLPDARTYDTIIKFYCENEMMDEAKKAYERMLLQKGCNPSLSTFRILMIHNCKMGDILWAYRVFKESVKHHKIPEFEALKPLVEGLVEKGYKKEAKAVVSRIMKKTYTPDGLEAWRQLADSLGLSLDETETGDLAPHVTEDVYFDEIGEGIDEIGEETVN